LTLDLLLAHRCGLGFSFDSGFVACSPATKRLKRRVGSPQSRRSPPRPCRTLSRSRPSALAKTAADFGGLYPTPGKPKFGLPESSRRGRSVTHHAFP